MALKVFKEDDSFEEASEEYVSRLNRLTPTNWVHVLTSIKPHLLPGVDPKAWPTYQKLILRIIQRDGQYYNASNFNDSPDGRIFAERIKTKLNSWLESGGVDPANINVSSISALTLKSWSDESKQMVDNLFNGAGIEPIQNVDIMTVARKIVETHLNTL